MNRRTLEDLFYQSFLNMDFFETAKVLGKMEAFGFTDKRYRYFEMLLLFEHKEYNKVRKALAGKKLSSEEQELYLASLAELKLYSEIERVSSSVKISLYCYHYLKYILSKQGYSLKATPKVYATDDTYFQDKFKWCVCFDLAKVYSINKEKLTLLQSNGSEEHIYTLREAMKGIIDDIKINDYYFDEIIECVENDTEIDITKIIDFPVKYIGNLKPNGLPDLMKTFDCNYHITKYFQMLCAMGYEGVDLETLPYIKKLEEAAENNIKPVIDILAQIYLSSHYRNAYVINDKGDTFVSVYKSVIERHSPDLISFIDEHEIDSEIKDILSPSGCVAYKAAVWQYDNTVGKDYGVLDAGMLCLSYMRILELELNEKIIKPLAKYKKDIIQVKNEEQQSLDSSDSKSIEQFAKAWSGLTKIDTGLELGPMYFLLLNLKKKKYPQTSDFIIEILKKEVLNEKGLQAVSDGGIIKWIDQDVREKFRNPPAHTRYVGLNTAFECRDYVIDKLKELSKMILVERSEN